MPINMRSCIVEVMVSLYFGPRSVLVFCLLMMLLNILRISVLPRFSCAHTDRVFRLDVDFWRVVLTVILNECVQNLWQKTLFKISFMGPL